MYAKRDYVQLAHVYEPKKHGIAGWFLSTKLDGQRAWWDAGRSRDIPASEVPYANTEKDARYKEEQICTGLFTRSGNIIHAPNWFLDQLPNFPLDGELWLGNNSWQRLASIIKRLVPDDQDWKEVKYLIFDSPNPGSLLCDGEIRIQGYKKILSGCWNWWRDVNKITGLMTTTFEQTYNYLTSNLKQTDNLKVLEQRLLPFNTDEARKLVDHLLDEVTDKGGEGLILRKPSSIWEPKRSHNLLKVKKFLDDEGIVTGYTTGRLTDKGSKLLGLMGALILDYKGKRLEISGFTETERILCGIHPTTNITAKQWAENNQGQEVFDWIKNPLFPRGSKITFRYRELSDNGIPKEARYWRKAT